jgi:hypothetical protein
MNKEISVIKGQRRCKVSMKEPGLLALFIVENGEGTVSVVRVAFSLPHSPTVVTSQVCHGKEKLFLALGT